jgi:hypothetical protein
MDDGWRKEGRKEGSQIATMGVRKEERKKSD